MFTLIYIAGILLIGVLIGIAVERACIRHQPFSLDASTPREPLR